MDVGGYHGIVDLYLSTNSEHMSTIHMGYSLLLLPNCFANTHTYTLTQLRKQRVKVASHKF